MKDPIIFRRDDCLSHDLAMYWKDLLYRTLKVGSEIEFALPKGMAKKEFMPVLIEALQPSGDLAHLGPHGVLGVVTEHCGVEIQVIGRQPYYRALIQQYHDILAPLPDGVRARPTCGLHYHALTVGLAEPVPEIILANVWNLVRRYAPFLRFLTSAGDRPEALCRRRSKASHLEMVGLTPGGYSMKEIQQKLRESKQVPEHQNFLNLEHVRFADDGALSSFHLEFRFPDADLCSTSIVAKTFLFVAIIIKAVEMSQYGVIHVGRLREWRRTVELLDMLSNNDGDLATSDTSLVTPPVLDELRVGSRELLDLLKPVFSRLARVSCEGSDEHPAFDVLSLLAETPLSLLRSRGLDWPEIEELLSQRGNVMIGELDGVDQRLSRLIELAELAGHATPEPWRSEAGRLLHLSSQDLEQRLQRLNDRRGLRWDSQLGTMVFVG